MKKKLKSSLGAAIVVILTIVSAQVVFAVEDDLGPWYPTWNSRAGFQAACLAAGGTDWHRRSNPPWCYKTCEDGTVYAADVKTADGVGKPTHFYWYFNPAKQCKASGPALVCSNLSKPVTIQSSHTLPYTFSWRCAPGPVTSATLRILVDKARMQWVEIPLTLSADGMSGTVMASKLPAAGKYWFEVILTNPRDSFKLSGGAMIIE